MNIKEIEEFLEKEVKAGNSLAISYVSFLKNATTPVKEYWFEQLGFVLEEDKNVESN